MLVGLLKCGLGLFCLLQNYLHGLSTSFFQINADFLDWQIQKNSKSIHLLRKRNFASKTFLVAIFTMAAIGRVQADIPKFQALGTLRSGTGSVTVPWPSHQIGDIALLFVESTGGQAGQLTTASGFSEVTNSPQSTTTSTTTGTRITVFWARATTSTMTSPVVADPGDHVVARILTYRGVIDNGVPWDVTAGGVKTTASNSISVTGVTTTVPDTLIVQVTSKDLDSSTVAFSLQTNPNLTTITERVDNGTRSGNGGGFAVWDGGKSSIGVTGNTTVTVTSSVNAFMTIALRPNITTLATGTDPAAANVAPGSPAQDVDVFTLQTNGGSETISSVTVNLSTNSGIGLLAITNNAGTILGSTAMPTTGSNTINVTGMIATAALTSFKVRVTPLSHAAMPLPPGEIYSITAPVIAWAGTSSLTNSNISTHTGTDTDDNALMIDNLSPASATAVSGGAGDADASLNWTTSGSSDFNLVAGSIVYRWAATMTGAEVPAEGSSPAIGSINGTATVACVVSSAASTILNKIDGAGGSADCTNAALSNGQAYSYKVFQKDVYGNYDGGVLVGTVTPASPLPPATSFDCLESINTPYSAGTARLYTKLTGVGFSFDVVALNASGGIATAYASSSARNVSVELVDGSGTTSCGLRTPISPAVSQTLTFNAGHAGRRSTAVMTVNYAYPDVLCRVTDASQTPSIVGCSSDHFAVRPTGFSLGSSDATADAVGVNASATPVIKTGTDFNLRVIAVAGYGGTPGIDTSKLLAHGGAVQTGILSGTFSAADPSTGIANGSNFDYSEVGYFAFDAYGVYDASFTAVDSVSGDCSNDFSNNPVAGKYGCKFGNTAQSNYFGRFIPDHFDVTLNSPIFEPGCSTFTYVGQPIKYATRPVATVTAKNASGATTQNYTGSLWKINPGDTTYGITPSYSEANQALTFLSTNVSAVADSPNVGTTTISFANLTDNILSVRRENPLTQFNAEIALSFNLSDTDAVEVANVNGVASANPVRFGSASAGNGIGFIGGNKTMRWGRLSMQNAFGSELIPLAVPLFSEYFNGSGFVGNTADQCTALTLGTQLSLRNSATAAGTAQAGNAIMTVGAGTSRATLANAPLASGAAGLSFSAPGSGNTGYIDITGNFSSLPWLLFDWDHDGNHDNSPSARASFGLYKGNEQQIYRREVY